MDHSPPFQPPNMPTLPLGPPLPTPSHPVAPCPQQQPASPSKPLSRQRSGAIRRSASHARRTDRLLAGDAGAGAIEGVRPVAAVLRLDVDTVKRPVRELSGGRAWGNLGPGVPPLGQVDVGSLFQSTVQKFPNSEQLSTVASTSSPKRQPIAATQGDPGLQEMKNYIGQMEALLHQMKDWVAKKECGSGEGCSDHSGVKLSLSREPKEDSLKVNHRSGIPVPLPPNHLRSGGSSRSRRSKDGNPSKKRKNIFFSKDLNSQWEEAVMEDSRRAISKERARSGSTGAKNTDGVFNSYIKECFLQKIKHNMLPSQSGSTLKRSNSFSSASPLGKAGIDSCLTIEGRSALQSLAQASKPSPQLIPRNDIPNEVIDYLTPERSARVISAESLLYLEARLPVVQDENPTEQIGISELQIQLTRKNNPGFTKDPLIDKQKESRRGSRIDSLVYTVSKNKSFAPRSELSPDARMRPSDIQDFE